VLGVGLQVVLDDVLGVAVGDAVSVGDVVGEVLVLGDVVVAGLV
jgi:hypothetical protein